MRVFVMAAGLGTRLQPLTDHLPKPMMPVANRPVLEHLLRRVRSAGVEAAAVNLHWHADAIRDYFGDGTPLGLPITWSYEPELCGTAGGMKRCERFLRDGEDCFVVLSGDGLHGVDLEALVRRHRASGALATLTVRRTERPELYGVVVIDREGMVTSFQEKPHPEEALSTLVNVGVYCFSSAIFERVPADRPSDFGREILPGLVADGLPVAVYPTDAFWSDVGSIEELMRANVAALTGAIGLGLPGRDAGLGVFIEDGAIINPSAIIEGPVLIGADAQIGPEARITGPAVIGHDCIVGPQAAVRQAVLLPGVELPREGISVGGLLGDGEGLADAWHRHAAR